MKTIEDFVNEAYGPTNETIKRLANECGFDSQNTISEDQIKKHLKKIFQEFYRAVVFANRPAFKSAIQNALEDKLTDWDE